MVIRLDGEVCCCCRCIDGFNKRNLGRSKGVTGCGDDMVVMYLSVFPDGQALVFSSHEQPAKVIGTSLTGN